jgi:sugar (pentulose or hexulose) kinase
MSRSNLWLEILSEVVNKKVRAAKVEDGTLLGCAICAAVGSEVYKDFDEAVKEMVEFKKEITPKDEHVEIYSKCYNTWKEWYNRIGNL